MSNLSSALNRIERSIKKQDPESYLHRSAGLSRAEIDELIKDLPIKFPESLYELYQWSNGPKQELNEENYGHIFILDGYDILPLAKAVETHLDKLKRVEDWNKELNCYNPSFFKVFFPCYGGVEGYIIINDEKEDGEVVFCHYKDFDITVKYINLTSMMLTLAECYEQGKYYNIGKSPETYEVWRKYNLRLVDELLEKLSFETSYDSLLEISAELIKLKEPGLLEPLIEIWQQPIYSTKDLMKEALVTRILGELGNPEAVDILIEALQKPYWSTRYWAAVSLGNLRDSRAIQALNNALQDSNPEVAKMAKWALKQIINMPI